MDTCGIIDLIYEAAVVPDGWPRVINAISDIHGAKGGLLFSFSPLVQRWIGAGESEGIMKDFLAAGWDKHNDRVPRLAARRYPGFVTDTDIYSEEEIQSLPIYQEFLIPRGVFAATATHIVGATDDNLIFSIEGFDSHDAARTAIAFMDGLRPHLARAASLASQMHLERARAAIAALEMIGAPAAFVTSGKRLRCANQRFEAILGGEILDTLNGLRFGEPRTQALYEAAVDRARASHVGCSIPLQAGKTRGQSVLHILPICGSAREVFLDGGIILLIGGISGAGVPPADLLQSLFDLTPAEARLSRALSEGLTVGEAAQRFNISKATARTQLKALFSKTGQSRQADLVRMFGSLALPGAGKHNGLP